MSSIDRMTQISVSTTFFPGANLPGCEVLKADVILYTVDSVFFYCHKSVLSARSSNHFGFLLEREGLSADAQSARSLPANMLALPEVSPAASPRATAIDTPARSHSVPLQSDESHPITFYIPEEAAVVNIVLLILYRMPCELYNPTVDVIARAFTCLHTYGLQAPGPRHDIWAILLRHAPENPVKVYTLGASNAMESLCTLASQYTLSTSLTKLSEADALTMGAIYLRRFIFLHLGREDALRRTIRSPPSGHDIEEGCSEAAQAAVRQGWFATVAEVLTDPQPQNLEASDLLSKFAPLALLNCAQCKENVEDRIANMIQEWVKVKRTI